MIEFVPSLYVYIGAHNMYLYYALTTFQSGYFKGVLVPDTYSSIDYYSAILHACHVHATLVASYFRLTTLVIIHDWNRDVLTAIIKYYFQISGRKFKSVF